MLLLCSFVTYFLHFLLSPLRGPKNPHIQYEVIMGFCWNVCVLIQTFSSIYYPMQPLPRGSCFLSVPLCLAFPPHVYLEHVPSAGSPPRWTMGWRGPYSLPCNCNSRTMFPLSLHYQEGGRHLHFSMQSLAVIGQAKWNSSQAWGLAKQAVDPSLYRHLQIVDSRSCRSKEW